MQGQAGRERETERERERVCVCERERDRDRDRNKNKSQGQGTWMQGDTYLEKTEGVLAAQEAGDHGDDRAHRGAQVR